MWSAIPQQLRVAIPQRRGEGGLANESVPKTERKPDHRQEPLKQAFDRSKNRVRVLWFP